MSPRGGGRSAYTEAVGRRLRDLRSQAGLTLAQVEEESGGRWVAVRIGSYERASRQVTIGTLAELAAFYGADVTDVLPSRPLVAEAFTAITGASRVLVTQDRERIAGGVSEAIDQYAAGLWPWRMRQLRERVAEVIGGTK